MKLESIFEVTVSATGEKKSYVAIEDYRKLKARLEAAEKVIELVRAFKLARYPEGYTDNQTVEIVTNLGRCNDLTKALAAYDLTKS
jgi:hypothetical protein